MSAKIGILVVHGIGTQDPDFADGFISDLNEELGDIGVADGAVEIEAAFWADLLNSREDELWGRLSSDADLDWVTVRRFVINVLADAVAYRDVRGVAGDMYRSIHLRIREHLAALRRRLGNADKPVIVVAHSLGSVIMGNYIWDEQHRDGVGRSDLEKMNSLAGLVTFGSNIPLFTLAYDKQDIKCFEFPAVGLSPALKQAAKWLNFYDGDDVLGYPLKPLSDDYRARVTEDRQIDVGGLFSSWNPISHTAYWEDDDFIEPVAQLVKSVVDAA